MPKTSELGFTSLSEHDCPKAVSIWAVFTFIINSKLPCILLLLLMMLLGASSSTSPEIDSAYDVTSRTKNRKRQVPRTTEMGFIYLCKHDCLKAPSSLTVITNHRAQHLRLTILVMSTAAGDSSAQNIKLECTCVSKHAWPKALSSLMDSRNWPLLPIKVASGGLVVKGRQHSSWARYWQLL